MSSELFVQESERQGILVVLYILADDECNTIEMGRQGKRLTGTARKTVYNASELMEKRAGKSILRMNVIV